MIPAMAPHAALPLTEIVLHRLLMPNGSPPILSSTATTDPGVTQRRVVLDQSRDENGRNDGKGEQHRTTATGRCAVHSRSGENSHPSPKEVGNPFRRSARAWDKGDGG